MAQHRQTAPRSIRVRTVIGGVLAAGAMVVGAGSMVLAAPAGITLADEVPPPTPVDPPHNGDDGAAADGDDGAAAADAHADDGADAAAAAGWQR